MNTAAKIRNARIGCSRTPPIRSAALRVKSSLSHGRRNPGTFLYSDVAWSTAAWAASSSPKVTLTAVATLNSIELKEAATNTANSSDTISRIL